MKKTLLISMIAVSSISLSCTKEPQTQNQAEHSAASWSYEGQTGPAHWAELDSRYATCGTGENQTPVNIVDQDAVDADLPPVKLDYEVLVPVGIKNTGHSIQVDISEGGSMQLDGQVFELKQFHFHSPSENTVDENSFPIEAHFVHQNEAGELAVIGMMFTSGEADKTLAALWENMPTESGQKVALNENALDAIKMQTMLQAYYRFNGSLTTPPCTEGVRWVVLKSPLTASEEQIETLKAALKHPNNRPLQPLNARLIID